MTLYSPLHSQFCYIYTIHILQYAHCKHNEFYFTVNCKNNACKTQCNICTMYISIQYNFYDDFWDVTIDKLCPMLNVLLRKIFIWDIFFFSGNSHMVLEYKFTE